MSKKQIFLFFLIFLLIKNNLWAQVIKDCRTMPSYVQKTGFDLTKSAFSTSENRHMGLCFIEFPSKEGQQNRVYQHPSWQKAGYLSAMTITDLGDIFVSPTPTVNVLHNAPAEQNFLFKADAKTAELSKVIEFPRLADSPSENPFGLMGMAYDCDSKILYISSLAGSLREKELGRVFAYHTVQKKILATYDSIDVLGVGLILKKGVKKLLLGKTKTSQLLSLDLNSGGTFSGKAQVEFSLEGIGPRGDDTARKIRMQPDGNILINGIEFYYNLIAPTEKQETQYIFRFLEDKNKWQVVKMN